MCSKEKARKNIIGENKAKKSSREIRKIVGSQSSNKFIQRSISLIVNSGAQDILIDLRNQVSHIFYPF